MVAGGETGVGRKGAALALLCVAQFVDVLDVNAVIIALHTIGEELGFSRAGLQWVVSAYVLFFAGFLLLAGRGADLWGRRRTFVVGLGLFTAASLFDRESTRLNPNHANISDAVFWLEKKIRKSMQPAHVSTLLSP